MPDCVLPAGCCVRIASLLLTASWYLFQRVVMSGFKASMRDRSALTSSRARAICGLYSCFFASGCFEICVKKKSAWRYRNR